MLLKLEAISYTYPTGVGVKALQSVDLEVGAGEIISITGASGSGKTSLLNILGLLQAPTSGTHTFLGESIERLTPDRAAEVRNANIGFVFQHHLLLPELTAVENVALNGNIAGRLTWSKALDRARQLIGVMGLTQRASHFPRQLSGGEQQRVAIARALINNPAMILADEPTGNLDSANTEKILKIFRALNEKTSHTLIIATHDRDVAAACSRQIIMEDGRIIRDDTLPGRGREDGVEDEQPRQSAVAGEG